MLKLYQNIKENRLALGMSQEELAHKTGYTSRSSIAKIEKGEVDLPQTKILLFAKALETTPAALMGWETDSSILQCDNSTPLPSNNTPSPIQQIFDSLNEEGQDKLIEYGNDLAALPKYKKCYMAAQQDIG